MAIAASTGGGGGVDPNMMKALLSLASGPSASGGVVYMGSERYTKGSGPGSGGYDKGSGGPLPRGKTTYGTRDVKMTSDEAYKDYFTWNQKKQSDFVAQGIMGGLLKLGDGPLEGSKLWKKLVDEAALYGAAGKKVTPFDLMATYVGQSGGGNSWTQQGVWEVNTVTGERRYKGPGKYLGNGQALETNTRVDLTDPDTAKSVATKLFQDMMGRDPGAGELGGFASALHSAEENSPVVQNTTTQYDMDSGQALSTSTESSGGVSAEGKQYIGEQQIKKKKEYGAFQAATTYENALESLVFGAPE
jgi:hypothetical protein